MFVQDKADKNAAVQRRNPAFYMVLAALQNALVRYGIRAASKSILSRTNHVYDCYMQPQESHSVITTTMKSLSRPSPVYSAVFTAITVGAALVTCAIGNANEPATYKHGVIIPFEGEIGPGLEQYVFRKLEAAKEAGADLVVLEIDSPGGRLDESLAIAWRMQELDWAHTVAYVPHDAISGAAIASLGCDEIIMAPNARWGDAGVIIQDEKSLFHFVPEKVVSIVTDKLRALAQAKGRPPALAEAISDKDLKVFHVRSLKPKAGQPVEETYISEREFNANPGEWQKLGEVAASGGGRFLALTGVEAEKYGLANALVRDRQELAKRYGVNDFEILTSTWVDVTVAILNSWLVTALLIIVGLTGLYFEFMSPGHGIGALVGTACFLLLFWSHFLGGTAGWLSATLFLLGLGCIAVEILLLPGTLVPGLIGSVLVLVSMVMVCQGFLVPQTESELHTLAGTMAMILGSCGIFVAAAIVITRRMETLPLFSRLMLAPPDAEAADAPGSAASGMSPPAAGDQGIAHTPLRPGGKGRFGERTIDVMASGDFLDRGTPIRVVRVSGNQVWVETVVEL
jgi:membrane-bound serine protease (ClpP class)